jgi:hypothetical protein
MRFIFILLITFSFTQELQVEGDLTVSGDIHSIVIDGLQNQITILNSTIDSLLAIQPIVVSELVELDIEILPTDGGVSETQYIDISELTSDLGEFTRVSVLAFDQNDLFYRLMLECSLGETNLCFGNQTTFQDNVVYETPIFMLRGDSPELKYSTITSYSGFATLYLLIEKFGEI